MEMVATKLPWWNIAEPHCLRTPASNVKFPLMHCAKRVCGTFYKTDVLKRILPLYDSHDNGNGDARIYSLIQESGVFFWGSPASRPTVL